MSKDSDPRWVWYGGRPSLDFVNTRRDRSGAGEEHLQASADLADWLRAAKLLTGPIGIEPELLRDALALRESIDSCIRAVAAGAAPPPAALRGLNQRLAAIAPHQPPRLRTAGGVPILDRGDRGSDARSALDAIAVDAAELIGTDLRARLRICPGPGCAGRFLDDSPAARRRWCSMAICGNRSKAATHRHVNRPT